MGDKKITLDRHSDLDRYNFHQYYLGFEVENMVYELFEVLEWYKKEAVSISKNYNVNADVVLASVTVLNLDAGNRATNIIKKYKEEDE